MVEKTEDTTTAENETNHEKKASPFPQVIINAQYVKDFSFENPNAPQSLLHTKEQPKIDLNFHIDHAKIIPPDAKEEDKDKDILTEITINLKAESKLEDKTLFIIELSYAGVFTVHHMNDQQKHLLYYIEGPRMLFPFLRSLVANATREGGFPPLMLSPIDFVALYQQRMAEEKAKLAEESK